MRPITYYILLITCLLLPTAVGCSNDAPPTGKAIANRDSLPVMVTTGVSKLISDSGRVRYKVIAEEWQVFDKTTPPRQYFPKGLFLQRLNYNFQPDLFITADTAYCYNQNLWELRGNVYVKNFENGTTFTTSVLFWDMNKHEVYSYYHPMHLVTPDRDVRGNWFIANESLTKFTVRQASGYMPMPADHSDATAAPQEQASQPAEAPTDTAALPAVRQRTNPSKKLPTQNPVKPQVNLPVYKPTTRSK